MHYVGTSVLSRGVVHYVGTSVLSRGVMHYVGLVYYPGV